MVHMLFASRFGQRRLLLPFVLPVLISLALACGAKSAPGAKPAEPEPPSAPALVAQPPLPIAEPPPAAARVAVAPVKRSPLPDPWSGAPLLKGNAPVAPEVTAVAAVVIDEASGAVLFDKDAHLPLPPASLTKIATLILALEHGRLD